MTIARKPTTAEKFIQKAKADMNRQVVKKRTRTKKKALETNSKKTKMTFYMDQKTYLAWQKYKLDQLADGNKISFQGTVEQLLEKILN